MDGYCLHGYLSHTPFIDSFILFVLFCSMPSRVPLISIFAAENSTAKTA